MKTKSPFKNSFNLLWYWVGLIGALILSALSPLLHADGPPPLPTIPGRLINAWRFSDTNWLSIYNDVPRSSSNVECVESWDGHSLLLDSTNAGWLNYQVVEP